MAASTTKPNEVRFAYLLLTALHANAKNPYLLLAVIAWVRAEGGTTGRYAGNNPLNLLLHGKKATFASLGAAARMTAKQLLTQPEFKLLVTIMRRGASGTDAATQGQDALQAIAMSNWDKNHYGAGHWMRLGMFDPEDPNHGRRFVFDYSKNSLLAAWLKLLGTKVTIPADVLPQPPPPTPEPPRPRSPDRRVPTQSQTAYIQPYASQAFLEARWQPLEPLRDP